ncbi:maleylpyruvate isomerase N-terminal domain-containing protein [Saccharopolyspora sp. NPDC002686]|uniref:maleylpyruvate isomerase N-terminal domain-containing protein n=1 Tax=Saccharopolyspora sp. NPDC002686 TaxID=3154541 RepID=UPI0033225727
MTASPIDDLALVLTATGELVAGVQRDQWDAATPCTDWNVRELVSHMVIGHRLFNGILRGEVARARSAGPDQQRRPRQRPGGGLPERG